MSRERRPRQRPLQELLRCRICSSRCGICGGSVSEYRVTPRRVEKPWGWELVWAEAEQYVGKLLFVRAGQALSLQYHEVKDEAWLVREGRAVLELGKPGGDLEELEIGPGDAFRYRPGTVHRVTAVEDTLIIEVSTPHLDDVVRMEDRYGREGTSAPVGPPQK